MNILKLWPLVLALVVGTGSWFGGYRQAVKDQPKCECPSLTCPPQANSIDIAKLKGFKGTFSVNQHYHVTMDGDSLVIQQIRAALRSELEDFKVKKCK
jgi:hypothetical protein